MELIDSIHLSCRFFSLPKFENLAETNHSPNQKTFLDVPFGDRLDGSLKLFFLFFLRAFVYISSPCVAMAENHNFKVVLLGEGFHFLFLLFYQLFFLCSFALKPFFFVLNPAFSPSLYSLDASFRFFFLSFSFLVFFAHFPFAFYLFLLFFFVFLNLPSVDVLGKLLLL